jgi:arginyl-tRNA--protein-N-Asp/Glu arginylyltransferase
MADTVHQSEIPEDSKTPDLVFYEGSCIFDQERKIKLSAFYLYRCTREDFDYYLELGYRKFAYRFFKYLCDCDLCSSIRIIAHEYSHSKTHKRVLKKNAGMQFSVSPLEYKESHYQLYRKHHAERGFNILDEELFVQEFYLSPVEAFITEVRDGDRLVGVGFIDLGKESLSSVYFIYDPDYSDYSLGIFSIIKEIDLAKSLGKRYYYLGLYCKGQRFLGYKDKFVPYETFDYETGIWQQCDK